MEYFQATWAHDFPDDPVWMAYEVDDARSVLRMIERFANGRIEYREAALEGWVSVSDQPFEGLDFESDEPVLTLVAMSRDRFDALWREDLKSPAAKS